MSTNANKAVARAQRGTATGGLVFVKKQTGTRAVKGVGSRLRDDLPIPGQCNASKIRGVILWPT